MEIADAHLDRWNSRATKDQWRKVMPQGYSGRQHQGILWGKTKGSVWWILQKSSNRADVYGLGGKVQRKWWKVGSWVPDLCWYAPRKNTPRELWVMLKLIQWPPATSISLHDLIQWNTNEFDFHLLWAGVWMEREHGLLIFLSMAQWMEHQHRPGFWHLVGQTVSYQLVQLPASRSMV